MVRGLWRRTVRVALLVGVLLVGGSLQAADNSLQLVPANAGFYSAMLNNKQQVDLLLKSKAFQEVWNLPQVQKGYKLLLAKYNEQNGDLAGFRQFVESPLGRDVVALAQEAVSEEIFVYGGEAWGGCLRLALAVNNAVQYGPLHAFLDGRGAGLNPGELQAYYALKALSTHLEHVQIPELVIGFKLKNHDRAEKLLKLFEEHAAEVMKKAPPPLRDAFKRTTVGKSSLLTFTVTGAMVPWERVPISDLEQKAGEFGDLTRKLKQMQATVSLGVHEEFLVLALTPTVEGVGKLAGKGPLLKDRPEFKMLERAGKHMLTDVAYTSKDLLAPVYAANADTLQALIDLGKAALAAAPNVPEERKTKMLKDLEALGKDMLANQPVAGAALSFNFLTPRGTEGYAFDWGKYPGTDGSKPLSLLNHVGGNPLLVAVGRSKVNVEQYRTLARYARLAYGHLDAIARDNLPNEEALKRYGDATKALEGLARKFDSITAELLYPATSDGQIGFVLDAKWTSAEWVRGAKLDKPMPMIEAGLLVGLSDAEKFREAATAYRKLLNEAFVEIDRVAPELNLQNVELQAPEKQATMGGDLYFYPLGEIGLDKQFQPTFGVGKDVFAFALSKEHATRLLAGKPLKLADGPLAERMNKPLAAATYLDFAGLIDALSPWAELGVGQALSENLDKEQAAEGMKALRTVLKVLKCVKTSSSATYVEDGANVTHSETIVKDLD